LAEISSIDVTGPLGRRAPRLLVCAGVEKALDSHCMVLEKAQFDVDAALGKVETRELLASRITHSLLVICYTILREDRDALVTLASEHHVRTYQLEQFLPPEELVRNVQRLLRECTTHEEPTRSNDAATNVVPIRRGTPGNRT